MLHFGKHCRERSLNLSHKSGEALGFNLWLQFVVDPERDIGIFGGVRGDAIKRNLIHSDLRLTGPNEIRDRYHLIVEFGDGKIIQFVRWTRWFQHDAGEHRIEYNASQSNSMP